MLVHGNQHLGACGVEVAALAIEFNGRVVVGAGKGVLPVGGEHLGPQRIGIGILGVLRHEIVEPRQGFLLAPFVAERHQEQQSRVLIVGREFQHRFEVGACCRCVAQLHLRRRPHEEHLCPAFVHQRALQQHVAIVYCHRGVAAAQSGIGAVGTHLGVVWLFFEHLREQFHGLVVASLRQGDAAEVVANDIVARRVGARGDSGAKLLAGLFERVGMERIEGAHEVVGIFYRVVALAASHVALALVVVDGLAAHLALVVKVDDGLR